MCLITAVNVHPALMFFRNNVEAALTEVNGKCRRLIQHSRRIKKTVRFTRFLIAYEDASRSMSRLGKAGRDGHEVIEKELAE